MQNEFHKVYEADMIKLGNYAYIDPSLVSAMYLQDGCLVVRFAGIGLAKFGKEDLHESYNQTCKKIFEEQQRRNVKPFPLSDKASVPPLKEQITMPATESKNDLFECLNDLEKWLESMAYCVDTADEHSELQVRIEEIQAKAEKLKSERLGRSNEFKQKLQDKFLSARGICATRGPITIKIEGPTGTGKSLLSSHLIQYATDAGFGVDHRYADKSEVLTLSVDKEQTK